jgi:hypothetical protein
MRSHNLFATSTPDLAALLCSWSPCPGRWQGFVKPLRHHAVFPDAVAVVMPPAGLIQGNEPVTASTAITQSADPHRPKLGTDARRL